MVPMLGQMVSNRGENFTVKWGQNKVEPSTAEPGALIAETPRCIFLPDSPYVLPL